MDPSLPSYRPVGGVVGVIGGHGTAHISELMNAWRADFERIYPGVRVELDDAPFEHATGACTFGPSVGLMREVTTERFKERFGYAAMEIPVCFYALGVFVHKDNPYEGGLPIEKVASIFSSDFRDLTWDDLGCGGEWFGRPISLYAPRHSATRVLSRDGLWFFRDSVKECHDDAAVVTAVAADVRAIGLASIGRRTEKVRPLAIRPWSRPATSRSPRSRPSGRWRSSICFRRGRGCGTRWCHGCARVRCRVRN